MSSAPAAIERLANASDRTSPFVFVGRDAEIGRLDAAVNGTRLGERGHTVVIQGVPGAGKTTLMHEYAVRLMAATLDSERPAVPVILEPRDLAGPPAAIVQAMDQSFQEAESSDAWKRRMNQVVDGAALVGGTLFARLTRQKFSDFVPSAQAPDSLSVAFNEYLRFRFDRARSTVVLMVDEAQSLEDCPMVRKNLNSLHQGIKGEAQVLLVCFGLANTESRLRDLGLSGLASDHVRTLGTLRRDESERMVRGTLEMAVGDRKAKAKWIASAAKVILDESANFPHHLANGCIALGTIAARDGIGDGPPEGELRELCKERRRAYYDARLKPWEYHTVALAHAFTGRRRGWTPTNEVLQVLRASDDNGDPVAKDAAHDVFDGLCTYGYVVRKMTDCRPALPSLETHFNELRVEADAQSPAVREVRATVHGLS